ncbi:NAD(P)-dependent oxidoreductase [Pseudonocardiaceae bacterium YIM PH 21723]|nr:NAD(P)-dependent oxidoreductase [Pseudonocardiaceae bacterium YIM PH 21723]
MTKFLLFGANGFVGRQVLAQLSSADVVTAGRSAAADVRLDLVSGGPDGIAEVLRSVAPDAVINCAGAVGGEPEHLAAVNISSTAYLAEAMLAAAPQARLVQLGSAGEYGKTPDNLVITEAEPPHPVATYGVTKLASTRLVLLAAAAGLDAAVLRVFNIVGPGAPADSLPGRLVRELRRATVQGDDVNLGPLDAFRDFVDVRDVASAAIAAATAPQLKNRLFNVAGGRAVRVRELVELLVGISGFTGIVREGNAASARSAGVAWQQADISLIGDELGWRPSIELETSLRDLWNETAQ